MKRRRSVLFAPVVTVLIVFGAALPTALVQGTAFATASPTVTGPIPGTPSLLGTNFDLSQVGYEQSEFFLSGTATSYTSAASLTTDGKWTVTTNDSASYTTRVVVRRPIDPTQFNGTVIVEWLNVSGALDYPSDWVQFHTELVRDGFAWVGVSAQWLGVNALKTGVPVGDPARYASLSHPGDSYSYDIFSQAGQAIRDDASRATPKLLDGLTPNKLVAVGHSQSAARLVTYIDALQLRDNEYDGYLVHGRGARGASLLQVAPPAATPIVPAPSPNTMIRDDVNVPVFVVQSETDMKNSALYSRQPDATNFRLWEIAGGSHFDYYALFIGPDDAGGGQSAASNLAAMQNPPKNTSAGNCTLGVNTGGTHWVMNAAIYALTQWVVNGTPPTSTLVQVTTSPGVTPVGFVRDPNTGIALGGVRSPHVDAPIATLTGTGNTPVPNCTLFGTTTPFTPDQIAALYKNHGQFVARWGQAAQDDVKAGFLLPADAADLKTAAAQSQIAK
jgi:Alpha/beta hydrolase domain